LPISKQKSFALEIKKLLETARSCVLVPTAAATGNVSPAFSQLDNDAPTSPSSIVNNSCIASATPDDSSMDLVCPLVPQWAKGTSQPLLSIPMQPSTCMLVERELARLKQKLLSTSSMCCSASLNKFPPLLAEAAIDIHRKETAAVSAGRYTSLCKFAISPRLSITDPINGRVIRPSYFDSIYNQRYLYVFDIRLCQNHFQVPLPPLAKTASTALTRLICPHQKQGEMLHNVTRVDLVQRYVMGDGPVAEPALVARDYCNTCNLRFLETHSMCIKQYPLSVVLQWGIDGDCNEGDPGFLLTDTFVSSSRYYSLHRGGAGNIAAMLHESCGAFSARCAIVLSERVQRWSGYLRQHVSDREWALYSPAEQIELVPLRAEFLFSERHRFDWPSDCHVAVSSPSVSSERITDALIASSSAKLSFLKTELQHQKFEEGHYVVSVDHSKTPPKNFSGPDTDWSLTICVNGSVWHFELVPNTCNSFILRALEPIGKKFKPPGCRVILAIDNMAHSGNTQLIEDLKRAGDVEAVVQDLFHVVSQMACGVNNQDEYFTAGKVRQFTPPPSSLSLSLLSLIIQIIFIRYPPSHLI